MSSKELQASPADNELIDYAEGCDLLVVPTTPASMPLTIWDNDDRLPLHDLIHRLDRRSLDAINGFLRAAAEDRIGDWIAGEIYPPRVLEDKPPTS